MKHTAYVCDSDCKGCHFCEGGLVSCTICNGAEGTLTIDCCGHSLDEHTQNAVYHGGLDFINGYWVVAPAEVASDPMRLLNWRAGATIVYNNKPTFKP
jgi:hypothetical protein